jgi:hypothetical protein
VTEVVHVHVDPHPPFGGVEGEAGPRSLCGRERLDEGKGGVDDRFGAHLRPVHRAQPAEGDAIRGHPEERVVQLGRPRIDNLGDERRRIVDMHPRRHRRQMTDPELLPAIGGIAV